MPSDEYPRSFPLGDSALTVEFGNVINEQLNKRAIALAEYFDRHPFPGYIESVPAYASTTLFYAPAEVRSALGSFDNAYDFVINLVQAGLKALTAVEDDADVDLLEIPVDFSARAGLDLEGIAVASSMNVDEVISLFTSTVYRVYMLGFLPGFSYMGEVDERIAMPRKATPRTIVPKGSVGIAGRQTGIYSLESPGGWQIVGRTQLEMFDPAADRPCFLKPGDRVKFVRV